MKTPGQIADPDNIVFPDGTGAAARFQDGDPNVNLLPTAVLSEYMNSQLEEFGAVFQQVLGEAFRADSNTQFVRAMASASLRASMFVDGGTANAYVLTPLTGSGGIPVQEGYAQLTGARILFSPVNANTGASTLTLGQTAGTQLASKKILNADGTALASGRLPALSFVDLLYDAAADGGNGAWRVLNVYSGAGELALVKATQVQAEAGTDNTAYMTALRVKQAIDSFALVKATQTQAESGTDNTAYMTALRVEQALAISQLVTKNTTGAWSVSGVKRNKPLKIYAESTTTSDASARLRVVSGARGGVSPGDRTFGFSTGDTGSEYSPPMYEVVPTATTVQFAVVSISNMNLFAWQ